MFIALFLPFSLSINDPWSTFCQITGGFIATLLGVSYSLAYDSSRKKKEEHNAFINMAKTLYMEISYNQQRYVFLYNSLCKDAGGLSTSPLDLVEDFPMWHNSAKTLSFDVYKGVLNSGDMKTLANIQSFHNPVMQAYLNARLFLDGVQAHWSFIESVAHSDAPASVSHDTLIKSLIRVQSINDNAATILANYLVKNGLNITQNLKLSAST